MDDLLPLLLDNVSVPFLVVKMSKIFEGGTDMLSRNFGNNLPIDTAKHPRNYTEVKAWNATVHIPFIILQESAAEAHPKPDESSRQKSHSFPLMSIWV